MQSSSGLVDTENSLYYDQDSVYNFLYSFSQYVKTVDILYTFRAKWQRFGRWVPTALFSILGACVLTCLLYALAGLILLTTGKQ